MRIALLTNFVAPYRLPLFLALARRVDALRVFVSTPMEPNRDWPADWTGLDVEVLRNVTIRRTWRHAAGFRETTYMHLPWNIVPALASFRPDVVISGELGARTIQSLIWSRYIGRRPLLVWATTSERLELQRGRETIRQWQLERAAGVLVNGESGARFIRRFGVPDSRIFRLPQPIDVAHFADAPLTRDAANAHRLLVVGSLTPRKGVLPLLDALERYATRRPDRTIEVLLAGTGPQREVVEARSLPRNVHLTCLGHVPYSDLPRLYAGAGILAFPSLADEWGLVVNEAMVSGLPVLGSVHAQAVEEMVEDNRTGWWFDPGNPASFDDALDRCLATSAASLDAMRVAARRRAITLDPEDGARRMLEAAAAVSSA